ncbi:MAG: undecaprenyl-diphosphate phosphatase [Clostridiales bacterium]|jgi:undecaprenyl-diphosphatase|nr:undecaprenyl-diphosphate phosphatase [Clostridiales bacterium]
MNILQAVVMGIVQGLAEFLPVSSSGHLVVMQRVFGIEEPNLTFDIVVHLGSLLAVIIVFWQDIAALLKKPLQKMTGLLVVGTVPAVAVAFLFKDQIERVFWNGLPLALAFTVTGVLLVLADKIPAGKKKEISYMDALVVGCMQAVGIPPGISRSGATISGALFRGLDRETAARFSFLLSIVAVAGAGALQAKDIFTEHVTVATADVLPMIFGFAASAMVGYLAIRLLLRLIKACKLKYFAYYVFALAAFILLDTFATGRFF